MKQSPDMRHQTRGRSFVGRASSGQPALPALGAHSWLPCLISILAIALGLRVLAAALVQWFVQRSGSARVCLFPDAEYYWFLARTIRQGAPFDIIEWGNIHHYALRTPGYPLFLAVCQAILGEQPLAVRLVQAALGTSVVWLVYQLTRRLDSPAELEPHSGRHCWTVPLIAATLATVNPYYIVMSELILSEAVFVPLMLLTLWGFAVLWKPADGPACAGTHFAPWQDALTAIGTGATGGAALLTRPSWGLFLPGVVLVWVVHGVRSRDVRLRRKAYQGAMLVVVGVVLTMGPWWARNARIYGRFVPTALWLGASLYDGLNPLATGASDMAFLADPALRSLGELGQNAVLTQRARFRTVEPETRARAGRNQVGSLLEPLAQRLGVSLRSGGGCEHSPGRPVISPPGRCAWIRRHDLRAWVLLAGPVLYFCTIHLVFVSSIRYRIPGEPAALGLAAIGLRSIADRIGSSSRRY